MPVGEYGEDAAVLVGRFGEAEFALAQLHVEHGELAAATNLLADSVDRLARARHVGSTILALEVVAELGAHTGRHQRAAEILRTTAGIRAVMGTRVPPAAARRLAQLNDAVGGAHHRAEAGTAISPPDLGEAVTAGRMLLAELRNSYR